MYSTIALELRNVNKKINDFQLNNISFNVEENSIVGILGPNASGKSTLLNILAGLLKIDSGEILFWGYEMDKFRNLFNNEIGFVQNYNILKDNSQISEVLDTIRYFFSNWDNQISIKLTKYFQLNLDMKVAELSQGSKQKLNLAILLSRAPKMLILDEPFNYLDQTTKQALINILNDQKMNSTILVASHESTVLSSLCDKEIFLENGRIINEKYCPK